MRGIAGGVIALALAWCAPAMADRYASPTGSGTACTSVAPCSISQAIGSAPTNDIVHVASGTYTVGVGILKSGNLQVVGDSPRPEIDFSSGGLELTGTTGQTAMKNVKIVASSNAPAAIVADSAGGLMEHVVAQSTGGTGCGIEGDHSILRDSYCLSTNGAGMSITQANSTSSTSVSIVNVTALGGSAGFSLASGGGGPYSATIANSIMRATLGTDVLVTTSGASVTLALTHDNYATATSTGGVLNINDDGSKQSSPPVFANSGDVHQAPTSPTIDAGSAAPTGFGATDLDGDSRVVGALPDIGADEYVAPTATTGTATAVADTQATLNGIVNSHGPAGTASFEIGTTATYGTTLPAGSVGAGSGDVPVSANATGLAAGTTYHVRADITVGGTTIHGADQTFTTTGGTAPAGGVSTTTGGGGGTPSGGSVADTTAPVLGGLSLTHRVFAIASGLTALAAAHPKGTVIRLTVSEAATVALKVQRAVPAHRRRTRYVAVATLTRGVLAGRSAIRFTGRIGTAALSKTLRPGRYRLIAVATDAAGNRSDPERTSFTVVRR